MWYYLEKPAIHFYKNKLIGVCCTPKGWKFNHFYY